MSELTANPLLVLIELGQRARAANSSEMLNFLLVNETKALFPYRQAILWNDALGVQAISGIVQVEPQTPFVLFVQALSRFLSAAHSGTTPVVVQRINLPDALKEDWHHWLPEDVLWVPLKDRVDSPGAFTGGLLLMADAPWNEGVLGIIREWCSVWEHAYQGLYKTPPWSLSKLKAQVRDWWLQPDLDNRPTQWWKRRPGQVLLATVVVLCFPVRLSVLAQGELVPANPAIIRAPLDGVIGQFHVRPNQFVKAGDVLFGFDEAPIASRLQVARQALATAEAEYRQIAQIALTDGKSKSQLSVLLGKIGEKRAEAEFLEGQFERATVTAPQDGIAIFDDPTEWIGKPVQTGERVMRVANPTEVEIEAWIPIADAIPLPPEASVSLYLAASPFASIDGNLRYVGHDAMPRPDGVYAYRLRATLAEKTHHRVGLKGTAKIYGGWVPFAYWVIRRPLAVIRQFVAI